jgi:hypothetical protein
MAFGEPLDSALMEATSTPSTHSEALKCGRTGGAGTQAGCATAVSANPECYDAQLATSQVWPIAPV